MTRSVLRSRTSDNSSPLTRSRHGAGSQTRQAGSWARVLADCADVRWVERPDDDIFSKAMDKGVSRCIEGSVACVHAATRKALSCSVGNSLLVDVATDSAYRSSLCRHFRRWLERTTDFACLPSDAIESALVEAVANGMIHGNLELPSRSEAIDADGVVAVHDSYYEAIEGRLDQPRYAERRLVVAAWWCENRVDVSVYNEGPGYDVDSILRRERKARYSGRGIDIIAAMCEAYRIEDNGRCITMQFNAS